MAVAALAAGAFSPFVRASITWDNSSGDAKWFTNTNWNGDALPTSSDAVTFPAGVPGGDSTIDLTGPIANAQTLTINDYYTFVNGAITLNRPGGTIDVAQSGGLTLTSTIDPGGDAPLTKTGDGGLTLTAPSTRSGETTIQSGLLEIKNSAALGTGVIHLTGATSSLLLGGVNLPNNFEISASAAAIRAQSTSALTGTITLPSTAAAVTIAPGYSHNILTLGDMPGDITGGSQTTMTIGEIIFGVGGVVSIPFANPDFGGNWSVINCALRIGDPASLGSGSSPVDIESDAGLELTDIAFARDVSAIGYSFLEGTGAASETGTVALSTSKVVRLSLSTGAATDTLTIGDGADDLTGGSPTATIGVGGSGTVILTQPNDVRANWTVSSGTLRLNGIDALGNSANAVSTSSLLEVNALQHAGTLAINGGTVTQHSGGGNTLILKQLSISSTGMLDMTDNAIIVHTTPLGTWNGSAYTGLSGLIQSGRTSAGTWDGAGGIDTSDPRAASGLCAIGIASASQVLGIASTATGTWHGQTVTGTDSLIAFTYAGDANLDGRINIDDYGRIDANIGSSGSVFGWYNGDFNYDGKINIDDYGIIDSNIGIQGAPLAEFRPVLDQSAGLTAVPEPAMTGILCAAGLLLLRRRRNARGLS